MYINNKEGFENNYNVIFAGTVRNVEPYIKKTLDNIDKCGKKFTSYAVIIYENDSTDNTRQILLDNKKSNYYYILEDNVEEPRRTMRIANGRNKILDKMHQLKGYDYLVMIDMDDINSSGMFVDTIDTCFKYNNWNALTGNQTGTYYDTWALRHPGYLDYDFHRETREDTEDKRFNTHYESKGLVKVKSAFGGIAIYKINKIGNCKYVGEYEDGAEQCEHVQFNQCVGNVYINTDFYTS